jgi:murein L,D-transpeptidase YcbB/YkuD
VKNRILAGAVVAALTVLCAPVSAATNPEAAAAVSVSVANAGPAVDAFYASRQGAPLWLKSGTDGSAAREFIAALQQASLDGFASGPALAGQAQALLARAQSGDSAAVASADRLLSSAWVAYVQALQTPPPGMTYADRWVAPRRESPGQILARAAYAPSLAGLVRDVSRVNPLYAQLRAAAWAEMQANGGMPDPRVLTSLERLRDMPFQNRYVMVDTAGARLYMIEGGRVADSMKVIVGRPDPATQTPMLASTIYYATLNPYWHVSDDLIRSLIAKNVLDQGVAYLKRQGYEVQPPEGQGDELLEPETIDWRAVADGSLKIRVRQLPGPANSMGRLKFGFANKSDIYLHDTPVKELFAQDDRSLSHGCIRLEDADRLGRWLLGREPQTSSQDPEQNVMLPTPVPIYLTYVTAQPMGGKLGFVDDLYGRDSARLSLVAASR